MTPTETGDNRVASELASALVAAQKDMPAVDKDSTNPHFRNRFTSLDHLIAVTKPVLTKHGLAILQFPDETNGIPSLTTKLLHVSGECIEATLPLVLAKSDMQGVGAALTYARRYAWASVLGIASEEDDDGNTASESNILTEDKHYEGGGQVRSSAGGSTISEAQGKRLWAIAKESNVDAEQLKALVKEIAGVDSSSAVPKDRYEALVEAVEAAGIPF